MHLDKGVHPKQFSFGEQFGGQDIVDHGTQRVASPGHFWLYKHVAGREDNLLCVAVVIDNVLVIKTVMHHWRPAP
jgi:hypothetical protein